MSHRIANAEDTGMKAKPKTEKSGVVDDVYRRVRDTIIQSLLAPGAPLIERPLAARLGVSRGSLRRALHRLEHEGFVRSVSAGKYSRFVVAPLTVSDMEDIYSLIAALDGAAALRAAALPEPERGRLCKELKQLNDRLADVLHGPRKEYTPMYELDRLMHECYVRAAAGERLALLYESMASQGERYGRAYATAIGHATAMLGQISTSVTEHKAIIDAICAGDAEAAELAAVRNWRNAAGRFRRIMADAGERGSF
jgi:DNA-binding GntR family transcriptional regulator